jgi:hypothetical protein
MVAQAIILTTGDAGIRRIVIQDHSLDKEFTRIHLNRKKGGLVASTFKEEYHCLGKKQDCISKISTATRAGVLIKRKTTCLASRKPWFLTSVLQKNSFKNPIIFFNNFLSPISRYPNNFYKEAFASCSVSFSMLPFPFLGGLGFLYILK